MPKAKQTEKRLWARVKNKLGDEQTLMGKHWSFNLYDDPKRLAFVLSRYKFAAKMISRRECILELGCSEGIGAPVLSEFALSYLGVDLDGNAIDAAKHNLASDKLKFILDDFLGKKYGKFDAVVSLDVVEHIVAENEQLFFDAFNNNLAEDGIGIIGTPNAVAKSHASPTSERGHVNLFDMDRLRKEMQKIFHNVFVFGMNDEIVHTGFSPMAHYILAVGCNKKNRVKT